MTSPRTTVISRRAVVAMTAAALMALPAAPVSAAERATGAAGEPTTRPTAPVVVAEGLQNPRGLVVSPAGTVYVATAGTGGTEAIEGPPLFGPSLRGNTGSILRVDRPGEVRTVVDGLPSFALGGFEVVGPAALTLRHGSLWAATAFAHQVIDHRPGEASVLRINPRTGSTRIVSDLSAYERAKDPDGFGVESDLNGIVFGRGHDLWVSDAGGNTVYLLDARSGAVRRAVPLPGVPASSPNPARGGANEIDPVPTGVAAAPDGGVFVSLLTGFPFPAGAASIVHVSRSGAVRTVATGLTALTDVEVGPDGRLYAVQFTAGFGETGFIPDSGRVLRVSGSGRHEVVLDELDQPFALAFDRRGSLYLTEHTNELPDAAGQGRILRYDRIARPRY